MSVPVPLMSGTTMSQNLRIPTFGGNLASYVQADDRNNISSVLHDWEP